MAIFPSIRDVLDSLLRPSQSAGLQAQATRQALSGSVATGVDLLTFKLGLAVDLTPALAATFSSAAGASVNFLITRHYVYGGVDQAKKAWTQFLLYVPAVLISLGLVQLMLAVFHLWLGFPPMPVKIASVPVVFVWTVLSGKYLIFNRRRLELPNELDTSL
jgi:putative flippase GtrA